MVHRSFNADAHRKSGAIGSRLTIRCLTTQNGVDAFWIGCPCHSPTPCPFATKPGWAHAQGAGACAHLGADGRGATQREREGHPMICARVRRDGRKKFLLHPLPLRLRLSYSLNHHRSIFELLFTAHIFAALTLQNFCTSTQYSSKRLHRAQPRKNATA